jgi:hypothetical protein
MPSLRELDATFLKFIGDGYIQREIQDINEAQGIIFLCPKCFVENNRSNIGVHSVICWFQNRGVPDSMKPGPGRWNPQGTGIDDLTFVPPGAVSVLLTAGCGWHGFVKNGVAE